MVFIVGSKLLRCFVFFFGGAEDFLELPHEGNFLEIPELMGLVEVFLV